MEFGSSTQLSLSFMWGVRLRAYCQVPRTGGDDCLQSSPIKAPMQQQQPRGRWGNSASRDCNCGSYSESSITHSQYRSGALFLKRFPHLRQGTLCRHSTQACCPSPCTTACDRSNTSHQFQRQKHDAFSLPCQDLTFFLLFHYLFASSRNLHHSPPAGSTNRVNRAAAISRPL